jgi:hypothetical protein
MRIDDLHRIPTAESRPDISGRVRCTRHIMIRKPFGNRFCPLLFVTGRCRDPAHPPQQIQLILLQD